MASRFSPKYAKEALTGNFKQLVANQIHNFFACAFRISCALPCRLKRISGDTPCLHREVVRENRDSIAIAFVVVVELQLSGYAAKLEVAVSERANSVWDVQIGRARRLGASRKSCEYSW